MPTFDKFLHYRKLDVSSFKEVAWRQYPEIAAQLQKPNKHRGLDDIQESIKELKFYLNNIFIPQTPKIEDKPEAPQSIKKFKP
jgi:oligoribonuclease